jgi:hypothetical protein
MVKAGLSFCDPEGCGTLPTVLARAALRILSRKLKLSVKTFAIPRINPFTRQRPSDAVPRAVSPAAPPRAMGHKAEDYGVCRIDDDKKEK